MRPLLILLCLHLCFAFSASSQTISPVYEILDTTAFSGLSSSYQTVMYKGYSWVRKSGPRTSNGGTIFFSASGIYYERIFSGPIKADWFGAKGDGATDDSQAIQKALKVANESAKTLFIPAGTYKITSNISVQLKDTTDSPGTSRKLSIEGDNVSNTILLYNAAADTTVLEITGRGNDLFTLKNLQIRRVAGSDRATGLRLNKMSQVHISNIQIMGFQTGFKIRGVNSGLFDFISLSWNQKGLDARSDGASFSLPNLLRFQSCTFNSNSVLAAGIYTGVTNTFSSCDFTNNGSPGAGTSPSTSNAIEIVHSPANGAVPVTISDSYFEGNYGTDIYIQADPYLSDWAGVATIRGCTFNKVNATRFATNHIKCVNNSGKQFRLLMSGNGTFYANGYVPDATRPFIVLNVTGNSSYYVEDSNVYQTAVEAPKYNYDRDYIDNQKTKLFATARISDTGVVSAAYNIASVTRMSTGVYQINFKRPTNGFVYPSITGLTTGVVGLISNENDNYSTLILRNSAGTNVDAPFVVVFYGN